MRVSETIRSLREIFDEVDRQASVFSARTGVRCPDGCGACCADSHVDTTVIEMLPLAERIWSQGMAGAVLERLRCAGEGLCVFYESGPAPVSGGRCGAYQDRPLICRLFGFFTSRDKHGRYVYGSCRRIREQLPDAYQRASKLIAEGFHPSPMTDYSIRVLAMDSNLGRDLIPINRAMRIALERFGLDASYDPG
ncbi:MAG: YkgJ family cysteine cluster protein [Candidatus Omnitrophica bacterium]|nr:YkgJ family cysteine cluster protein [Candidatus Omnitrophota bacterium]